ncbi:MAG TPA: TatD family deoxyribonuclease [Desulfobacteraceae bacterium]|nr:TatD family deoxyribonuclease [Desulfobacteraceae bacterium]
MKKKKIDKPQLAFGSTLIDTHCHLDMDAYEDDLDTIVANAATGGITRIVTVGIDLPSSREAVALAKRFPGIWATIGIHPHNAESGNMETYRQLQVLAADRKNKVIGYGEIGLDFARNYAPRPVQITAFNAQINLAKELHLPIIIHDRDAHDDTLAILRSHAPFPDGGVMHCFSGDLEMARKVMDLGLLISIPGIVTFNKSEIMQQVAGEIPLEKMILETDGPFLAPVPFRGKTNKPEYLLHTAQKIADLRGVSLAEIARQTTANAENLFRLPSGETVR